MEPGQPKHDRRDAGSPAALVAAASAALAASGAELSALGTGDLALCVVDATSAELPIVFANRPFLQLSGYDADEIVGRDCRILLGPETDSRDLARFRGALTRGRPFQAAIVNHRKTGEAVRNEIFVSPVRDAAGEVVRYVGILVESPEQEQTAEGRAIAALRHQFRNQIQTMTSLVSLLGQRMPEGEGREAFEDLRARFEAINVLQKDDCPPLYDAPAQRLLSDLAQRIVALFDPGGLHRLEIAIGEVRTSPRRTAALAQILAELLILTFRNGFGVDAARGGTLSIGSRDDGDVEIRAQIEKATPDRAMGPVGSLGVVILENLVRALGGSIVRRRDDGFEVDVVIPREQVSR